MRPSRTNTARAAMLGIGMLLVLGASAPIAAAGELSYPDADTIMFTAADNLNHQVQFRLSDDAQNDEIIDIQQFTSIPGNCTVLVANTWISCPGHMNVQADFGAGNDSVTTAHSTNGDCFLHYTFNMGEGANETDFNSACTDAGATATINSGSGDDTLRGAASTTVTTINAGGGNDTLRGGAGFDIIHGGEGNEEMDGGGAGNDQLFGEGGNDVIRGGPGNDLEDGGSGDDQIGYSNGIYNDADEGADDVRGGSGNDKLILDAHPGGVTITLDDQPGDGSAGEGDNIHSDIENIIGSKQADDITGGPGPDNIDGDVGNDTIHGGAGDDTITGNSESDKVYGDAGNDTVYGSYGDDTVDGGSGRDSVFGDLASCSSFTCPAGNDQLFIRDGELDQANCGAGADTVQADQLDVFSTDGFQACESVDRQTVAVPGGPGEGAADPGAAFALKVAGSARSKSLLKKGLSVRLKCPGACKITAELRYKSKKLGSARKTLKKAGAAKLIVRISKKAKRTIRKLKKGNLTLRVKVTVGGKTTTITRTVKFKH
jgi:Ca2+-binding RTX toxin-like protein